jgi:hypothetical protein
VWVCLCVYGDQPWAVKGFPEFSRKESEKGTSAMDFLKYFNIYICRLSEPTLVTYPEFSTLLISHMTLDIFNILTLSM